VVVGEKKYPPDFDVFLAIDGMNGSSGARKPDRSPFF
jgi:hypothetical protein